ncbi:MAG: hypothetical protein ACFFDW_11060 [Candidatus Thorarchaeota archaeon]
MKKSIKIVLIVTSILVILGIASFGGTLLYTKNNVSYEIGEATVTNFIVEIVIMIPPFIDYNGYIVTSVPFELTNNGLYGIIDMQISLKVYGQNFNLTPALNDKLLGQGSNQIGDIAKKQSWSGNLEINITANEDIIKLAVNDGELRVVAEISLKLNFGIFKAPVKFEDIQIEPWDSPF